MEHVGQSIGQPNSIVFECLIIDQKQRAKYF